MFKHDLQGHAIYHHNRATGTPVRRYAGTPVRRYAGTPVRAMIFPPLADIAQRPGHVALSAVEGLPTWPIVGYSKIVVLLTFGCCDDANTPREDCLADKTASPDPTVQPGQAKRQKSGYDSGITRVRFLKPYDEEPWLILAARHAVTLGRRLS